MAILNSSGVENIIIGNYGHILGPNCVGTVWKGLGTLVLDIVNMVPDVKDIIIRKKT